MSNCVPRTLSILFAAAALFACGGGGDSPGPPPTQNAPPSSPPPPPPPPPSPTAPVLVGAFGGKLTGTQAQDIILVAEASGARLLAVYGRDAADGFKPAGLLSGFGSAASTGGRFVSEWTADYDGVSVSSLDVSFDPTVPLMSGSVVAWPSGATRTISGGAMSAIGYQMADAARLETVGGRWTLETSRGVDLTIDIGADGRISSPAGGCRATDGQVRPSVSGNVYSLYMNTDGCNLSASWASTGDVAGFALAYVRPDGAQQLVIGADNTWELVYAFIAAAGKR